MKHHMSKILVNSHEFFEATQSTSKYEGVSWNEKRNLWQAEVYINDKKQTFYFDNDFDAAKKLNTFCDKMKILSQNSEICEMPNQQVIHIQIKPFLVKVSQFVMSLFLSHRNNVFFKELMYVRNTKRNHNIKGFTDTIKWKNGVLS